MMICHSNMFSFIRNLFVGYILPLCYHSIWKLAKLDLHQKEFNCNFVCWVTKGQHQPPIVNIHSLVNLVLVFVETQSGLGLPVNLLNLFNMQISCLIQFIAYIRFIILAYFSCAMGLLPFLFKGCTLKGIFLGLQ